MVGRAGPTSVGPGSLVTGISTPVRLTTNKVVESFGGELLKITKEAAIMATIPTLTQPEIAIVDGQAVTSSLAVANFFSKRHDDVLKKIRTLECSASFTARNFSVSDYTDCTGRKLPCYQITRDGFAFLAMGFTGKRAAQFKEAYINAFNQMEKQLSKPSVPSDVAHNASVLYSYISSIHQAWLQQLYPMLEKAESPLAVSLYDRIPAASQPLADDPAVRAVFRNEAVIRRAGGVECLESWLLREKGCQWPHSDWHSENMTTMRHAPGAIRLCWHCDNQLRDQFTERLESMATDNCVRWVLSVVRRDLGFDDSHVVTMPELCWWLVRNDLADALPESAARKALRLPKPVVPSVTRESDLVPSVPATSIIQDKAKKVLALKVDPESPESFMLRPKRRRWVNEKYTRWVKTQPCACCGKPADDPHHLTGHGQGGMGTKAHDLFVLPLCRKHHDELHADTVAFEEKYGSQLELIFRFIDRALAIGVLA